MPDYSQNYLNMLGGKMDLFDKEGKIKPRVVSETGTHKDTLDIREIMTNIVGRGYKSLSDDTIRGDVAKLGNIIGITNARKMVDHAIIFNQNASNTKNPVEARVQSFFSTPSSDGEISALLKRVSGFGDGVVAGMRRSPDTTNMQLSGTYDELNNINKNAEGIIALSDKTTKDAVNPK